MLLSGRDESGEFLVLSLLKTVPPKSSMFCFSEPKAAHPNRTKGFKITVDISCPGDGEDRCFLSPETFVSHTQHCLALPLLCLRRWLFCPAAGAATVGTGGRGAAPLPSLPLLSSLQLLLRPKSSMLGRRAW